MAKTLARVAHQAASRFAARCTGRQYSSLPAPWERTYVAQTREEMLDAYTAWASTYDEDSVGAFGYAAPAAAAAALAERVSDLGAAILDAGAGTGQVGEHLASWGFSNIAGVDFSQPMLDLAAQKKVYSRLLCADLTDGAALPLKSVDAIVCVGTLTHNHVVTGNVLRSWLTWLRPGSLVVLSLRDDFWAAGDSAPGTLAAECAALENEGMWRMVAQTAPALYTPRVSDTITFHVRTYRLIVE